MAAFCYLKFEFEPCRELFRQLLWRNFKCDFLHRENTPFDEALLSDITDVPECVEKYRTRQLNETSDPRADNTKRQQQQNSGMSMVADQGTSQEKKKQRMDSCSSGEFEIGNFEMSDEIKIFMQERVLLHVKVVLKVIFVRLKGTTITASVSSQSRQNA